MTYGSWLHFACLFLVSGLATSFTFITYDAVKGHGVTGRSLLQTLKPCNMSFEEMDYSILTNNCKGPVYQAKLCCAAFKEFACPYAALLNDEETTCASSLFSYINLYGKYPPGLFSNYCVEGEQGLDCNDVKSEVQKNGAEIGGAARSSLRMLVATGLLVLFFQLF